MVIVLLLKLVALAFAGYESVRAHFFAGIGALVTLVYLTLARLASVLPPYPNMPLRDALQETWWLYPAAALFFALGPMVFAFRTARALPAPRNTSIGRAGAAFGIAVLLDAAVLIWGGLRALFDS